MKLHLCRAKVLEYRQVRPLAQPLGQGFGQRNATAHHHHVDVLRRAFKENVAHISTHHITLHAQFVGRFGYLVKYFVGESLLQFFLCQFYHFVVLNCGAKIQKTLLQEWYIERKTLLQK